MKTGDRLGRYELGERIGAGAMSEVFASRHPLLERDVAIKVLKKEVCSDQQYVARFLDDARAAHGLNNPNIVRVLDVDDSEAQPFIVMDLVKGQPLDEWRSGQVELPVAVQIMRDVASALAAAHSGGLIHRDVKPSNVLIEQATGVAKLTDFGAAKREREGGQELTQMGQRIGTPRYMAPEQVEGQEVSKCTDLFALGALGYELLAGRPAFEGESVSAVFHGILFKQPTPLSELRNDVPASLVELIDRLLQKKPSDRPASAEEVVAALDQLDHTAPAPETIAARTPATSAAAAGAAGAAGADATVVSTADLSGAAPPAPPAPPPGMPGATAGSSGSVERSSGGLPVVPIAAGIALLLVVLGGGWWLFSGGDEPPAPEVAATDGGRVDEPAEDPEAAADAEPEPPAEQETAAVDDTGDAATEEPEPPAEPAAAAPEGAGSAEAPSTAGADQATGTSNLATALREEQAGGAEGGGEAGEPDALPGPAEEPGEAPTTEAAAEEEPVTEEVAEEEQAAAGQAQEPDVEPQPAEVAAAQDEAGGGGEDQEAAAGTETPTPEQAETAVEAEPGTETAALPGVRPPDLPADVPGVEQLGLNCGEGEPGCTFAETVAAAVEPIEGGRPEIILNKEDGVYLDQEYLVVEVAMPPDLGGYLYLDVYTDNGEVFHLLPEPLREGNDLSEGAMIRVGVEEDERATGIRHWQISGPFGTGWLMALVTENRLFSELRPIGETIEAYRPVLLDALDDPKIGRTSYSVVPVEFRPR